MRKSIFTFSRIMPLLFKVTMGILNIHIFLYNNFNSIVKILEYFILCELYLWFFNTSQSKENRQVNLTNNEHFCIEISYIKKHVFFSNTISKKSKIFSFSR